MAVDKLKALEIELQSKCDAGLMSEQDAIDALCSFQYEELAPALFANLYDVDRQYKSSSFRDGREELALFTEGMNNYRESLTNYKGEFAEDLPIHTNIERMVRDFPNIPELQDNLIARELHQIGQAFIASPLVFARFIQDLTAVQYLNIESYRKSLESSSIPLPVPEVLIRHASQEKPELVAPLNFQQLFDEFLAYKQSTLTQKQYDNYCTDFPIFLHFIGNKPINQITTRDLKRCLQSCLLLPKRNLALYKGKPIAELADMDVPEEHRLADRSVLNFKKLLQGIFAYAKEQEYLVQSPAIGLKLDLQLEKKRTSFKVPEVIRLLNNAMSDKHEWRKWFVLLAAYTGARRGEIAQLRAKDFKLDEESKIEYLLITDEAGSLKTGNALRRVPIHPKLIELGIKDFVAKAEVGIFPEGDVAAAMTRFFPSLMEKAGVEKFNELQQSRSLHSLRHSFITETRGNGFSTDLVQSIVGHEITSAGQTDIYTSEFSIEKLFPVVNSLKYV